MVTTVDRLGSPDNLPGFGEGATFYYVAQTFRAEGKALNSVEFKIDTLQAGGIEDGEFRLLVTTFTLVGGQFQPVSVLFESSLIVDPSDPVQPLSVIRVDTGKLALVPGTSYALILDARVAVDGTPASSTLGLSHSAVGGPDYTNGFLSALSVTSSNRATDFAANWDEFSTDIDLSFRLTFSNPGITIIGTKGRDTVDAVQTVKGQPLPTGGDDSISGLGDRDHLSGLGGDDTLDGGKDQDTLFGGDGQDLFLFSAGLKKNAPDKVMDFVPVDDTILLAMAKFKGLAQGAITDAAFRDIGEAASDADRIIYKASGKLLADKDGKGGDDPQAFAKLIGAPDIGAGDFLVV